ncbi:hypothetical protein GA0115252_151422 [Streptomyces sp. DfronAA-171]|nr:hypothetical protein GA0115252_151422 [Streptomyces sp. DfronAA-171]
MAKVGPGVTAMPEARAAAVKGSARQGAGRCHQVK